MPTVTFIAFSLSLVSFPSSLVVVVFVITQSNEHEWCVRTAKAQPANPAHIYCLDGQTERFKSWLHLSMKQNAVCNSTRSKVDKLMLWCHLDSHHISIGKLMMHTHKLICFNAEDDVLFLMCHISYSSFSSNIANMKTRANGNQKKKKKVEKMTKQSQKDILLRIVYTTHIMIFPLHSSLNAIPRKCHFFLSWCCFPSNSSNHYHHRCFSFFLRFFSFISIFYWFHFCVASRYVETLKASSINVLQVK